jgi:hypothetical protein
VKSLLRRSVPFAFVTLAAFGAACSNGSKATVPTVSADVRLSADNATTAAAAVYRTSLLPLRVARVLAGFLSIEPEEGAGGGLVARDVQGPDGGTAIFTWDDRDGDGAYSTGDAFGLACDHYLEFGLDLTGNASFEGCRIVGEVVGGLNWTIDATLRLAGMEVVTGNITEQLEGSFVFAREKRQTVNLLSLDPAGGGALTAGARTLLPGYSLVRNDYVTDFRMGLFVAGAIDDATLGGRLTFATEQPLLGLGALPDPSSGELLVRGGGGTSVTLVPLDFFTLELQVDDDGDGEVDQVLQAEWASL